MSEITIHHYIALSAIIFSIGVAGVLTRKNAIILFMSIELMLNSSNLALIAFASFMSNPVGQIFALFVIAVAAAEVGVGLAIIVTVYRNRNSINIDDVHLMKG
ncbi:MAG: NADH-quinone oxidoreductase subunit NuoK [bacterium]|nr:NADH-quinone oxidoreductase subunit NuoK [bacterium]